MDPVCSRIVSGSLRSRCQQGLNLRRLIPYPFLDPLVCPKIAGFPRQLQSYDLGMGWIKTIKPTIFEDSNSLSPSE